MPAFLATMEAKIVAVGLLVAAIGGAFLYVYGKGETAASSTITSAVQTKTIQTIDAARISKERTDEEVHRTPYDDRVDGVR